MHKTGKLKKGEMTPSLLKKNLLSEIIILDSEKNYSVI